MKKVIFLIASILYVFPYQLNLLLSGPDIALVLSFILACLVNPLAALRQYLKQFPVLGRLFSGLILFQIFYIIIFLFHGGSFPSEPFSDSLMRAVRSLYPFFSMACIAIHVFVLPKFININPFIMLSRQTTVLVVISIISLLNIFSCRTIYGGTCLLNQNGYSATGFMSLSAIILLLLSLTTNPISSGLMVQLRKLLALVALFIFLILLINAGSRAAMLSLAIFVITALFFGYIRPLVMKGALSFKSIIVSSSLILLIAFYFSSGAFFSRTTRIFFQLLESSDVVLDNARGVRYYSFDRLTSGVTSIFGSGNFSFQPNPLGTSWYDGAYIWFQNNYGVPGLIALLLLILSLLILSIHILRIDSLSRKNLYRPSVECIISISAIFSFVIANSAQEVFALNTVSAFTIYVLAITSYFSLLKASSRPALYKYV